MTKTYSELEKEWKERILSAHKEIKTEYSLLQSGAIDKSDMPHSPLLMTNGYSHTIYFKEDYNNFDIECRDAISGSKNYLCVSIKMEADVHGYCDSDCIEVEGTESYLQVDGYEPVDEIDFESIFLKNDLRYHIEGYFKNVMDVGYVHMDCTLLKLFRDGALDEKTIIKLLKEKGC